MTAWIIGMMTASILGWCGGKISDIRIGQFIKNAASCNRIIPWACALYAALLFGLLVPHAGAAWSDYARYAACLLAQLVFLTIAVQDHFTMHSEAWLCRCMTIILMVFALVAPHSLLLHVAGTPEWATFAPGNSFNYEALFFSSVALLWIGVIECADTDRALSFAARKGAVKGLLVYGALLKRPRRPRWAFRTIAALQCLNLIAWLVGGASWHSFYLVVMGAALSMTALWLLAFGGSVAYRTQAMGSGDLSLLLLVGALTGAVGGLTTIILGAIVCLVLTCLEMLCKKRMIRKAPFLPGLVIAAWLLMISWPSWTRVIAFLAAENP